MNLREHREMVIEANIKQLIDQFEEFIEMKIKGTSESILDISKNELIDLFKILLEEL